jgi:hypothetical protein
MCAISAEYKLPKDSEAQTVSFNMEVVEKISCSKLMPSHYWKNIVIDIL